MSLRKYGFVPRAEPTESGKPEQEPMGSAHAQGASHGAQEHAPITIDRERSPREVEASLPVEAEGPAPKKSKQQASTSSYEATRIRTFKPSWRKQFRWVVFNEEANTVHCSVCREFPRIADGNST